MATEDEEEDKMTKELREKGIGTRSAERREAELRVIRNMEYQDKLYIPPEIIPKGMEYGWGTISVLGVPTPDNMIMLRRKGWEPVPADRHPELAFSSYFEESSTTKGFITRLGSILIERPLEYREEENKMLAKKNEAIVNSMPGTEHFLGEPSIPTSLTNNFSRETTKNASFGN